MAPSDMRVELHQFIDRVDDRFLQAVHGLLSAYLQKDQLVGYELDGSRITAEDFVDEAEKVVREMKEGKQGIRIEELEERSKEWQNRMR